MIIIDLLENDIEKINQTARLLHESFEAWPTIDSAIREVLESLSDDSISRVLVNGDDEVIGWIGGRSQYDGNVWELHPLVIRKDSRMRGLGKSLVIDFECQVYQRGGITIILGTDDEYNQTSLANVNLYDDIPAHLSNFESLDHPANFYRKLGFVIVGVIPDANGIGKPDIIMAKRVKSVD